MGVSNLEARIKKLENTSQSEFGTPANTIFFPVRKLMLSEEKSHNEDGVVFPVLVATWDKPAGVIFPESIRLIHNGTTVSLAGTATSYRMAGYAVGNTVTVKVTAIYIQGASSTVTAVKTITGDTTPPSVPTNLTVAGGFRTLTLRWENPTAEDFSHVEIWESVTDNNIATAERIAQAYGTEFVRSNCAVLETRWYWIRALDTHGNYSDFTSVASGTTTAIAMEDVPDGTIAESMLISELASEINKIPAIEVDLDAVESRVSSAESERTLLAAQVAGNTSAIQSEQTTRANADSAMASQITTLISDVGDNTAAIETVSTVAAGKARVYQQASAPTSGLNIGDLWIDNNGLIHRWGGSSWLDCKDKELSDLMNIAVAQQWLKVQATAGGKYAIAGIGVMADATTGSEIAMLADRFYLLTDVDGEPQQPFAVDGVTGKVVIDANLIVDGSITGEKIFAESVIQLNTGGQLLIGANGLIQCGDGFSSDTVVISEGAVRIAQMIDGTYRARQVRTTNFASGQGAKTNQVVYIPGYFASPPIINVSINELKGYLASKGDQDQTWRVYVSALTHESHDFGGGGNYSFTPVCQLILSSSIAVRQPDSSISGTTQWEWASASALCPSTTTQLVMTGSVSSKKGTGLAPYYYKRAITCQLQASTNSGSTWTALGSAYQLTIQDLVSHAIEITVSSISKASDFLVRAYFTANNVAQNPTFDGGGTPFQYDDSADITALNLGKLVCNGHLNLAQSKSQALFTSQYSPPSGWTIYNVTTDITVDTYINKGRVTIAIGGHTIYNTSTDGRKTGTAIKGTFTFTTSEMSTLSSGTSSSNSTMQATTQRGSAGYQASIEIKPGSKITFGLRKPNINSTTVDNSFEYKKVTLTLRSAESLADGYVNWTAFGP